ncbi:hypothetical protein CWI37_0193p0020 [Hamiltosporidium tvaerminnensis]|uniref:Uncharacterized protein n=1 Tax=Hamiltosporidium tvaerminnensis TaxID=1176355 RepID=A0A4V2JVG7_9MICR|nr:hypothetical protein CWI37_0193p0020 [Hamiltosporidium tvaerminnensis]
MLSFRILYTFFCFFKEYLVGYSDMFNEHPCFKNMLERILGKHLILNYIEYDRSFAENNEIEIKLLEFDLNAYFEKESIIFNLENSQTPTEAALSHMMQPEIEETVTFGSKKLTITAAQSLNASDFPEKDVNMIEVNEENATLNSYSKTYQTFAERNKVTNQTDNVILSSEVMRMNTEEINHSRNNIIYKSDSKDILKLDLELFFEKIFQANLEIQAKNTQFFEYKKSDLYKKHKEMCQNGKFDSNHNIFSFFYKILYLNYETQWKTLLSSIPNESYIGYGNILAYLDEYILSSAFQMNISNSSYFISIEDSDFPKMYLDEIVLVFDIDDTIFPTSFFRKKNPNFGSTRFYENSDLLQEELLKENPGRDNIGNEIYTNF